MLGKGRKTLSISHRDMQFLDEKNLCGVSNWSHDESYVSIVIFGLDIVFGGINH